MKQETNTMQTKEGLDTQNEWFYIGSEIGEHPYNIVAVKCDTEERAELIVKAVNERQALLDVLKELSDVVTMSENAFHPANIKAKEIIKNNAKNITS